MIVRRIVMLLILASVFSGCATGYMLVPPGPASIESLQLDATAGWNQAPPIETPSLRKGAALWTHDGPLLDQLIIVPGVPDGEALLGSSRDSAALPRFRKDMLPNEIQELAESTLVKYFGEGSSAVTTRNLRPQLFGKNQGLMFDFGATVSDSPDYRGTAGAFVVADRLYVMLFLAAVPHYFDKHADAAGSVIKSARLSDGSSRYAESQ